MRDFKFIKSEGAVVYFNKGTYNTATGVVKYTSQELPAWLSVFNNLHKSSSKDSVHLFATIYGILLLFLAISSLFLFLSLKPKCFTGVFYLQWQDLCLQPFCYCYKKRKPTFCFVRLRLFSFSENPIMVISKD